MSKTADEVREFIEHHRNLGNRRTADLLERLQAENDELKEIIGRILHDLPRRRDWLDPVYEAHARALIQSEVPNE